MIYLSTKKESTHIVKLARTNWRTTTCGIIAIFTALYVVFQGETVAAIGLLTTGFGLITSRDA